MNYLLLGRLHQPIGFLLLFWPCAFGLALAKTPSIPLLVLFFVGSVIMRAAGCTINDIVDRDVDRRVERTKNRPIASGKISTLAAFIFLFFLCSLGALILLSLNRYAIYIGLFSLILIPIYPFMKRITKLPQLFLGFTFNIGSLISYAHVTGKLDIKAILLYVACVFWTLGYDTIYGIQDMSYDKKIGIKSTSITFEKHLKIFLGMCFAIMIGLLMYISPPKQPATSLLLVSVVFQILWQIFGLDQSSPKSALIRFKSNGLLGLLMFLYLKFS